MENKNLISVFIKSPIEGIVYPIENVPDQVFAQKMVGDGIAIEPISNVVCAPFDGQITTVHASNHAVALKANGVELLIHIGVDTVLLKGEGFKSFVKVGQNVKQGQTLIEFDLDKVATKVKSLITSVIITNTDKMEQIIPTDIKKIDKNKTLLEVKLFGQKIEKENLKQNSKEETSNKILIKNHLGIHARPAATFVNTAKKFQSDIKVLINNNSANGKSVMSLMGLDIRYKDKIIIKAKGEDSSSAIKDLENLIKEGLGEKVDEIENVAEELIINEEEKEESLLFKKEFDENKISGIIASSGLAIGKVCFLEEEKFIFDKFTKNKEQEIFKLDKAIFSATEELKSLEEKFISQGLPEKAKIFSAHQELLSDPQIYEQTVNLIKKDYSAEHALNEVINLDIKKLQSLKNPLLQERAIDLKDICNRVLYLLLGKKKEEQVINKGSIIIAEDLSPSQTANLDPKKVVAFCTTKGGATSHSAILARALNIPALVGLNERILKLNNEQKIVVDAKEGNLLLNPSDAQITKIKSNIQKQEQQNKINKNNAKLDAITTDGIKIEVAANIGSVKESDDLEQNGANGVGLLRSEFLFLQKTKAPTEQEQFESYRDILKNISNNQPLIVRTMDVGGDKPLNYLPLDKEDNPFLGMRGIRVSLDKPSLLRTQIRAILRAQEFGNIHIMFPMISSLDELLLAKEIVKDEAQKLGLKTVPLGIMIEVPSAAIIADVLAKEVDFFSIGTNDLTQYTLAMDRGHPKLAALADALNPSVLQLIKQTIDAGKKHNVWCGICGGVAGDINATALFVGLGIKELSLSAVNIANVKARIRELDINKCKELGAKVLNSKTTIEVHKLLDEFNN